MLDKAPESTQRFTMRAVILGFVIATSLFLAMLSLMVGLPAGLRYLERGFAVLVVGAFVTAAALLPKDAWTGSNLGSTIWRVGCVGAWLWALVALGDTVAQWVAWDAKTPPYGGAEGPYFASLGGQFRIVHVALIGIVAAAAPFTLRAGSGPFRGTARGLIAAAAATAVLALPSPSFEHLPWAVRTTEPVHGLFASMWLGPLVFLVVFVACARVDDPKHVRGPAKWAAGRPFTQGDREPPNAAYGYLRHAADGFSNLALVCAVAVLVTGVAMGVGAAEGVDAKYFFADPWGWEVLVKAVLGAALIGFGAIHRAVTLRRLNGEPLDGLAKRFVPRRWREAKPPAAPERTGAPFVRLAAVEVVVLFGAVLLGVAMNLDGAPRPPAVTLTSPGPNLIVDNHTTITGTANIPANQQLWVLVEDVGAAPPYYLSTDAPIAVDSSGSWQSTVTLGKSLCDPGPHRLIVIVVPDGFFTDEMDTRPGREYSVRLPQVPEKSTRASVFVTARGC